MGKVNMTLVFRKAGAYNICPNAAKTLLHSSGLYNSVFLMLFCLLE